MTINLYDHQKKILSELERGAKYVVAQPRTGKTRPVIARLSTLGGETLVLTKKAAVGGWESELEACGSPPGWTVTNYEQIRTKKWDMDRQWGHLVCDEAHTLATFPRPNLLAPLVSKILTTGERIGVSATPSPESYGQLFHQARALKMGLWTDFKDFYRWFRAYGIPAPVFIHGRKVETYKEYKQKAWDEFSKRCCVLDRATAAPDFIEAVDVPVPIVDQELADLHHKLDRDRVVYVGDDIIVGESKLGLEKKLHQVCSGAVINDEGKPLVLSDTRARWLLSGQIGPRIAVLTQFQAEVDMIHRVCTSVSITDDPRAFLEGYADWFAGNIQRFARGVDLSPADAVVFFSLPWSAETYIQARERALRGDRTKPCNVYFPFLRGGMDEMIYKRVAVEKRDFNSAVYRSLK